MQNSFLCICRKIHRYWRQIWCVVLRLLATTTTAAMIRLPILAPNFFFSSDTCQSCKEDISRTSSKSILCIPYYYYLYMYNSIFFYGSSSLVRLESVSCVLYLLKYPRRRGGGGWHCQAYHDLAPKSTHICPCDSHFRSKIQSTASPFSSLGVDVDPRGRHQGFEIIRSSLLLLLTITIRLLLVLAFFFFMAVLAVWPSLTAVKSGWMAGRKVVAVSSVELHNHRIFKTLLLSHSTQYTSQNFIWQKMHIFGTSSPLPLFFLGFRF